MHICALTLRNFRIYQERHFEFGPEVNLICGPNAVGKTTILEAIYLLTAGRSFRTSMLKDLIHHQAEEFFIELIFVKHGVEQCLRMSYSAKEKKIFYNQTPFSSISGLIGILAGTVMVPDDTSLVKGGPGVRRQYLDIQLAQTDPLYMHHLARYHKAMRQRNFLLKNKTFQSIEVWEQQLANSGSYLIAKRTEAVTTLQECCQRVLSLISGNHETIRISYKSHHKEDFSKEYYQNLFKKMREKEMRFGITLVGPHRDDVEIVLNNQEVRHFASEGQQRSCATALRIAEWERLHVFSESPPLMLIDDLGISLDSNRREKLLEYLSALKQVFITTTEKDRFLRTDKLESKIELFP